ncbi:MAG: hypothetical protein ACP5D1_11340 [Bacteroidales bacterium]
MRNMIAEYYRFNQPDPAIEWFISRMNELRYRYYVSELLEELGHTDEKNLQHSIRKTMAVLRLTGIPVQKHFTEIYRYHPTGIRIDWKISVLACSLIIINYESPEEDIMALKQTLLEYLGV